MRTESSTGLILRVRPLTETSLIIHWLTPELGRIATVAKGARRPKSSFRGKLDLFYEADFNFQRSLRSELHALREVSLTESHSELRNDLAHLRQASYCAALIEQTTESETFLPGIFELFTEFITRLPRQPARPRNIFAYELKLLRLLGLEPDVENTRLSGETCKLVSALLDLPWTELASLKATGAQVRELQQFLHGFLQFLTHLFKCGRLTDYIPEPFREGFHPLLDPTVEQLIEVSHDEIVDGGLGLVLRAIVVASAHHSEPPIYVHRIQGEGAADLVVLEALPPSPLTT